MSFVEPFADELLSSWLARVRDQRAPGEPLLRAYRNRAGHWRHPDVNPKKSMIAELAASEGFTENSVAELGLCYRYPRITPDFVAWHHVPSDDPSRDFAPALTLRLSWCSRCLAEDYAAGRPAYIRADWAMAAWGFCFGTTGHSSIDACLAGVVIGRLSGHRRGRQDCAVFAAVGALASALVV
jgi:hypothetical protein